MGGYGTNLQETTAATNNSRLRTFAAPSTKAGWEQLAAADDENLAAYFTAFPAPYASEYYETASFDSRLVKRQVVKNCTSTGPPPNPNDPPPPPPSPRVSPALARLAGARPKLAGPSAAPAELLELCTDAPSSRHSNASSSCHGLALLLDSSGGTPGRLVTPPPARG